MVYKWLQFARSWAFPARCALCDAPGHAGLDLCRACRADLTLINRPCLHCAAPLPSGSDCPVCGACQRKPPHFHAAIAPFHYQEPLAYLIRQLKFAGNLPLAGLLGGLMARTLPERHELPDCLIPVPLHPRRLRERGFNQALEISRVAGAHLSIPVNARACVRTRVTAAQSLLPRTHRESNVRGAFRLQACPAYRRVAIVDDVMTTGHTVNELAHCIARAGGARHIEVWAVARAGSAGGPG